MGQTALRVGILCCGSMAEELRVCAAAACPGAAIYPLIPSCTFLVKADYFRQAIDRRLAENDILLFAYGLCHPELAGVLDGYGDAVVRLSGDNCYQMFLGDQGYAERHDAAVWMLNKPFFTRWKNDLLAGFSSGTARGRNLLGTFSRIDRLRFPHDGPIEEDVRDFAARAGLPLGTVDCDLRHIDGLLRIALVHAGVLGEETRPPAELEAPSGWLKTIVESIGEILFVVDAGTREITWVSPQAERILGYEPVEIASLLSGGSLGILFDGEAAGAVAVGRHAHLVRCVREGAREPFHAEYRARAKDGRILRLRESLWPEYGADGALAAFVGRLEDVSEIAAMQDRVVETEKLAAAGSTAAILAHQINSPLQAVTVLLSTLRDRHRGDDALARDLEALSDAFSSIKGSVLSLLALGRSPPAVMEPTQVNGVIHRAVFLLGELAASRRIRIALDLTADLPQVLAPPNLIQVLLNLCNNSVEAMAGAERPGGLIEIRTAVDGTDLVMTVGDDGPGIPPEDLERVFHLYYTRRKTMGFGLGLPLCRSVLADMGGSIRAGARPGGGALFTARIPLRPGDPKGGRDAAV